MKKSIEYLKELKINKNEYIVIACSGGPDSMTLLHLLKDLNYKIICAHVNHNLRIESNDEYTFVQKYCKENNIIFEGMKIESYTNNKFTENEARTKRYNFFETILKKYNSNYLLTAHHGDDLIETILMRLIRGSNLSGYKGFSKKSYYNNFYILRPLIFYTKKEIENYANNNNIPYVVDRSNSSKKYTRNRLRLGILPLLKKENKNIHTKFLEYSEEMEEIQNYIQESINNSINNNFSDNTIDLNKFLKLNILIQKKELEEVLFYYYKENISLINKTHIRNILKISNSNNKSIELPHNIIVKKEYNLLKFMKKEELQSNEYNYIFNNNLMIKNIGEFKKISTFNGKSNYVIKLNSNKIKLPIIIRTRRESDEIEVKNLNGNKKIKKIFIDEKIKKSERDSLPIVTDSNNTILWIPGIKKSKFDCSNQEFYDIIIKYIKKGE